MTHILVVFVLCMSLLLTACQPSDSVTSTKSATSAPTQESTSAKSGDTVKTGVISGQPGAYFLQVSGQPPLAVDSYSLDVGAYLGQTVTVTGQYSGNTLFIGSIQ